MNYEQAMSLSPSWAFCGGGSRSQPTQAGTPLPSQALKRKPFPAATVTNALFVLLVVVYIIITTVAALLIRELVLEEAPVHLIAWTVAGICVAIAIPLSLHDMLLHFRHYSRPAMQRCYLAIIFFVPVFASQSWLALRFHESRLWFVLCRDMYEAFVLWSFYTCMAIYVGPHEDATAAMLTEHPRGLRPIFPLCCMPRWRSGEPFFVVTFLGVIRYAVLRTGLGLANLILVSVAPAQFDEGNWSNPQAVYVYFFVVVNASQMWASECIFHQECWSAANLNLKQGQMTLLHCSLLPVDVLSRHAYPYDSSSSAAQILIHKSNRLSYFLVRWDTQEPFLEERYRRQFYTGKASFSAV